MAALKGVKPNGDVLKIATDAQGHKTIQASLRELATQLSLTGPEVYARLRKAGRAASLDEAVAEEMGRMLDSATDPASSKDVVAAAMDRLCRVAWLYFISMGAYVRDKVAGSGKPVSMDSTTRRASVMFLQTLGMPDDGTVAINHCHSDLLAYIVLRCITMINWAETPKGTACKARQTSIVVGGAPIDGDPLLMSVLPDILSPYSPPAKLMMSPDITPGMTGEHIFYEEGTERSRIIVTATELITYDRAGSLQKAQLKFPTITMAALEAQIGALSFRAGAPPTSTTFSIAICRALDQVAANIVIAFQSDIPAPAAAAAPGGAAAAGGAGVPRPP